MTTNEAAALLGLGPERVSDQFEPRLMELLDQAEMLARKMARGRTMKKTLKRVAGVRVRLAHAGSSAALKSDPAALAFVDEYDEMNHSCPSPPKVAVLRLAFLVSSGSG